MFQSKGLVLELPLKLSGEADTGKRVKVVSLEYKGTALYYSLYLPDHWQSGGIYPVVVEYTGNKCPRMGSSAQVKDAALGYAIAKEIGAIWIGLPYVSEDSSGEIFLCGFSHGAIGVNFFFFHRYGSRY